MTAIDIAMSSWKPPAEFISPVRPEFIVVDGEKQHQPKSRDLFEDYFALRTAAEHVDKPEGEELDVIQSDVREWLENTYPNLDEPGSADDYRAYSIDTVDEKIGGLANFLKDRHADKVSDIEHDTTTAFIESVFAMYAAKDTENLTDQDGSFGFVVPMRMSRKFPEYGQEIEPIIPLLRYVPNEMRAWIMRGLPPFIADTYKPDENGRRGYLICAPSVTEDMKDDLARQSLATYLSTAQGAVNDAVDFARDRLGVRVAGLGATLPAVTNYGKSVSREDVITTTGHGGTIELICATIDSLTDGQPQRIGVLGLGAIGASVAEIAAEKYDGKVNIFDTATRRMSRLSEKRPGRFTESFGIANLIEESDVVISAVTEPIKLSELELGEVSGKLFVDDSQPASFDPKEVGDRGGTVVWVIGQDASGAIQRTEYDYGTMAGGRSDLFGCEAEAAVLERHLSHLEFLGKEPERARAIVGRIALKGPVTAYAAGLMGKLFTLYGIGSAKPQAFGEFVDVSRIA